MRAVKEQTDCSPWDKVKNRKAPRMVVPVGGGEFEKGQVL